MTGRHDWDALDRLRRLRRRNMRRLRARPKRKPLLHLLLAGKRAKGKAPISEIDA